LGKQAVESMDIQDRFTIPIPVESRILSGRQIDREAIQTEQEQLEQARYEENGGNPVLD